MQNASAATCGVVLDRHIAKNAGTTIRTILTGNAKAGRCEFVPHHTALV